MVKRYDDTEQFQFIESQFDAARQFKLEQAKKQEKFAKNLFLIDTAAQGANFAINQAAKESDQKQLPKLASYQNLLDRTEKWRTADEERVKKGQSVEQFLTERYLAGLKTEAQELYGNTFNYTQYSKALYEEANNLAKQNKSSYNNFLTASKEIPTFQDFEKVYKEYSEIPRNIASWITGGVKNFFSKETEETLKNKNEKVSDALYGTELFKKFENLENELRTLESTTGTGIDVVKLIDDLKLKGRIIPELSKLDTQTDVNKATGVTTETTVMYEASQNPDGSGVVYTKVPVGTRTYNNGENLASYTEISNFYNLVKNEHKNKFDDLLNSSPNSGPTRKEIQDAMTRLNENPDWFAVDWTDEGNKSRAFEIFYSALITGYRDENNQPIAQDIDKDGIFTIIPSKLPLAQREGLDKQTALKLFNKLGFEALQLLQPQSKVNPSLSGTKDLTTLIDPSNIQAYNSMFTAPQGAPSQVANILAGFMQNAPVNQTIFDLGMQDLELLFPNVGLTGTKQLFFNVDSQQFLFK